MGLLSLTDPSNGTATNADLIASNNAAIKTIVNGQLDASNLAAAITAALCPPGIAVPFAGASAPSGWLICDGTSYLRATYPGLFAAIGTTWGAVDGDHFNVPDMRDQTAVGKSGTKALGSSGGAATVTLTGAQSGVPAHAHPVSINSLDESAVHQHSNVFTTYDGTAGGVEDVHHLAGAPSNGAAISTVTINMGNETANHHHLVSGNTSNNTAASAASAHENLPPYKALNFIIKV